MFGMQILRKHFLLLLSSSQSNWIVVFGLLEQKKSWFLHSFVVVVETQKVRRDVVHLRQTWGRNFLKAQKVGQRNFLQNL